MTKDDIIRMAQEAGWDAHQAEFDTRIECFAPLVAAHEREACARVCEETNGTAGANYLIAKGIRARGTT